MPIVVIAEYEACHKKAGLLPRLHVLAKWTGKMFRPFWMTTTMKLGTSGKNRSRPRGKTANFLLVRLWGNVVAGDL